ncbi:MAG: DUF4230 domain-containing protein [Paludibacteraceae bacterium]|nr:DUF4230 domain-containing protein [Paludibacteraceae bacterium]
MKKSSIFLISTVVIIAVTYLFALRHCVREGIEIERNEEINSTPNIVTEVKKIGKWEFLSIKIEELVDTTKGVLFKDKLSAIYLGTLRYGIDCSKAESDWFTQSGDTVFVSLPEVSLLDDYFLDEAATKTVFASGSFSSDDRRDLRERAIRRMLAKSEKMGYRETAQENAKEQITMFLQQLGIKNIVFMDRN